jgi:NAD-dependent dihydropyrimidine dehydrogenase PreA subunit
MAAITNQDSKELKEGIVRIHKMMELRKLHLNRLRAGKVCGICESFCEAQGMQKQTREFIHKYQS